MRPDAVHRVHGPLRRHRLQQLQRHRGRADQHRDAGRPAGGSGHRRAAGASAPTCGSSTTTGAELPPGEVGRITGAQRLGSSRATPRVTPRTSTTSYMVSGDLGRLDDAGRLYVVGRDDEMIVSGGENVYPLEVEADPQRARRRRRGRGDRRRRPGVRAAARGVRRAAARRGRDGRRPKKHVKAQLAGYKVPREVAFLDDLPRNASGKVMKRELVRTRVPDAVTRP